MIVSLFNISICCGHCIVVPLTSFSLDLPLTPIVEGFVILKKNPDYDES